MIFSEINLLQIMSGALTVCYDTFEGSCPLLEHPSIHFICHLEYVLCSIFKL